MNPILFVITWGVTLLMSIIVLIIEIPLKLICTIISTIFVTFVAIFAPIIEKLNFNIPDKISDGIENFCKYGLTIKEWLFLKTYNVYKKILL